MKRKPLQLATVLLIALATSLPRDVSSTATAAADKIKSSVPHPPIVVCGAGPASLFFAMRYLQLCPDARIEIYEKRGKPSSSPKISGSGSGTNTGFRAFGFGIGERAQAQLAKIPTLTEAVESVGEPGARSGFWFVNHRDLCAQLTRVLNRLYGDRCTIRYNCPVIGLDDKDPQIRSVRVRVGDTAGGVSRSAEEEQRIPYSLLIAGDGANSVIRQQLEKWGEIRCQRYYRNLGWKALQLPPQPLLPRAWGQTYGVYSDQTLAQNKKLTQNFGGLLPRFSRQFVLLMFWRKSLGDSTRHHVNPFQAQSADDLTQALALIFPNVTVLPPRDVLEQFLQEPHGVEVFMKANHHALPHRKIALMGDAAAGMYSTLGQGVASAWERANVLAETLVKHETQNATSSQQTEAAALAEFSQTSREQAYAITDLNLIAHVREIRWLARLFFPDRILQIYAKIMNPAVSYQDLARQNRWVMRVAKWLWRFQRVPFNSQHNPLQDVSL